ncbi:hypothetical protein [Luteolibacter sp. Populi]|uniref:hypothetical protein n=1 Tax=Luteolibacter sp. Populi TaxID=3230487 RepID=UPI003465777B
MTLSICLSDFCRRLLLCSIAGLPSLGAAAEKPADAAWKLGAPITTYWAGPGYPGGAPLDDAAAERLVKGGWNLVWCHENELDVAHRHGLRALLYHPLLGRLDVLENPSAKAELDALISRVKGHAALYAYHLVDEPDAGKFPALGKIVAYLKEKDPATLPYINLLPTYANNSQLGTTGEAIPAYEEHLKQYVEVVKPELLSYDHYQFTRSGDNGDYFLNLGMIRKKAISAGIPFMNIVQASSWVPGSLASPSSPRVPDADELRFLGYSSLAYGAQAISYYVYCYPNHEGGMETPDTKPTPLYQEAATLNPAFIAIAKELQPFESLAVMHDGMKPRGTESMSPDSPFRPITPLPAIPSKPGERVRGIAIGLFGPKGSAPAAATHGLVVNLDYKEDLTLTLSGPGPLEAFDEASGKWSAAGDGKVELTLRRGAGKLLRLKR